MTVKLMHLQPGARWVFVHRSGKRVEYVYERLMVGATPATDKGPGKDAMHALRNPQTGKDAMVGEKWLKEGPMPTHGYWEAVAEASSMAEAA